MSFSEIETNEIIDKATNEILHIREAKERITITIII
jgi:hypothetical protein